MSVGPSTKGKFTLGEGVRLGCAIAAISVAGYAYVSDVKAQQKQDQSLNELRLSAIAKLQDDSAARGDRIIGELAEIKAGVARLEGRMESK